MATYKLGVKMERERILNLIEEYDDIYGLIAKDKLLYMIENTRFDKDASVSKSECSNSKDGVRCGEVYAQEGDNKIQYICNECESKQNANVSKEVIE